MFLPRQPASVSQLGRVPAGANSLLAWGATSDPNFYAISFDGVSLPVVTIDTTPNYTLVGVDVSSLGGQNGELRFSMFPALSNPLNALELNNSQFSTAYIPEPGSLALLAVGALLLGWR